MKASTKTTLTALFAVAAFIAPLTVLAFQDKEKTVEKNDMDPAERITKTEEEWKKILTPEQFRVARKAGTEVPFGETYKEFKKQGAGAYHCAGCGIKLFTSKEKFDAKCGWPAFYDPANAKNVATKTDKSAGMIRTEVTCAKCDAHLGHLFKGEGFDTPVDQRYCINGIVLKFVPEGEKFKPEKKEGKK